MSCSTLAGTSTSSSARPRVPSKSSADSSGTRAPPAAAAPLLLLLLLLLLLVVESSVSLLAVAAPGLRSAMACLRPPPLASMSSRPAWLTWLTWRRMRKRS